LHFADPVCQPLNRMIQRFDDHGQKDGPDNVLTSTWSGRPSVVRVRVHIYVPNKRFLNSN